MDSKHHPLSPKPKINFEGILCFLLGGLIMCLIITIILLPEIFVRENRDIPEYFLRNNIMKLEKLVNPYQTKVKHISSIEELQEITCVDGNRGYINDDYCDCADGEDETHTSACSHVLAAKQVFVCDHDKKVIYASRIMDGVFDCQDHSDE